MRTLVFVLVAFGAVAGASAWAQQPTVDVETIYIARSVRLSRVAPTDFCAESHTGFPTPAIEDQYDFKAVASRSTDGIVTNAAGPTVGQLHACFGRISDARTVTFYAEGHLNGVHFTGRGDCRSAARKIPEPGITAWHCYLELTDLSGGFSAGLLTTNTVTSREVLGLVSDPAGYAQPSIATVRLWRKR
jgi:hypothetical protein